ncbi:MAG: RagB/SusD family nutrient uptake outer membrane protein [Parabacteroides sp.]|nr:RagB/SusD family nutrient uptake outer membrane protein [Parabacteroides sp.]
MLAECYNENGNQAKAVELINQVRQRAGIALLNSGPACLQATSKDQVFERIKHERAIEFAAEGIRYNDLKRWGTADLHDEQPGTGGCRRKGTLYQNNRREI